MVERFPSREAAIAYIAQWIPGLERVIRYLTSPPQYALIIAGKQVTIGPIERLLNQQTVRAQVADAIGVIPEYIDPREGAWRQMVQALLDAREDLEAPEAEEYDLLRAWISAYLEDRSPVGADDAKNYPFAVRMELPISQDGQVMVNATNLARWVTDRRGVVVSTRQVALLLRRYGATYVPIYHGEGSSRRRRRYWALPADLLPEDWSNPNTENAAQNAGGPLGPDVVQMGGFRNVVQNAGGPLGPLGPDVRGGPQKDVDHVDQVDHMAPGRHSLNGVSGPYLDQADHTAQGRRFWAYPFDPVQGNEGGGA